MVEVVQFAVALLLFAARNALARPERIERSAA
jgi:hypothetical protein